VLRSLTRRFVQWDPNDEEREAPAAAQVAARFFASAAGGGLRWRAFNLRFWDGSELPATADGPVPTIVVRDAAALAHVLREPDQIGLGRAWIAGLLDIEGDLSQALALRHHFDHVSLSARDRLRAARCIWSIAGPAAFRRPRAVGGEARLTGRRHSLGRDRSAVRHHYDVPEAFYRLILGPSMVYSCAYFEDRHESLERAQERKLELICRKLHLRPGDRLLDVGCGWGSLVLHAATHHGVRAVGVTLSESQADVARARVRAAGLADRCDVRVADYREIADGPFDAIASVGMYEHVGRRGLDQYARTVAALLRPGGLFLNHGITRLTPGPGHDRTFVARFVFPDGELHPVTDILSAMQNADLEVRDLESLREHYALTLQRWLANLDAKRDAAVQAAGPERERIWRLYMTGAASAFEYGELSVFQTLAARPGASHRLPLTRRGVRLPAAPRGLPTTPCRGEVTSCRRER
jgi:cyclopropane-fatty-acyl-phospholipid synthase